MKPTRFMSRPFYVKGFKVTASNMQAVADWCEGAVVKTSERSFVRVPVQNARSIRQTEANIGDWVLKSRRNRRNSFKVYDQDWLLKNFMVAPFEPQEIDEEDNDLDIEDEEDHGDIVGIPFNRKESRPVSNVRPLPVQGQKNVRFGAI